MSILVGAAEACDGVIRDERKELHRSSGKMVILEDPTIPSLL